MQSIKLFGLMILYFVAHGLNGFFVIVNQWGRFIKDGDLFPNAERYFAATSYRIENEIERRCAEIDKENKKDE